MLHELVAALLRQPTAANWESWLAVLSQAVEDERAWTDTINGLDLDDQLSLVETLKRDEGIFADALQILTARNAERIVDEQVREYLLADAASTTTRRTNWLRAYVEQVTHVLGNAEERRTRGLDEVAEVARLDARLFELHRENIENRFGEMQRLERDIHRLESLQEALMTYDAVERAAHRDRLVAETAALAEAKKSIQDDIVTSAAERDRLQQQNRAAQLDLDRIRQEIPDLTNTNQQLRDGAAELDAEVTRLREEHTELSSEMSVREEQIHAEKARICELRDSPSAQRSQQIIDKVREIYALLPADNAEASYGA